MHRIAAVLVFLVVTAARAEWRLFLTQSEPSPAQGLEHRYLVMEDSETGDRASLELAIFAVRSFRLRVIDQASEPRVPLATAMAHERCIAGVNGGYFDPDYNPIGLLIVDGKT